MVSIGPGKNCVQAGQKSSRELSLTCNIYKDVALGIEFFLQEATREAFVLLSSQMKGSSDKITFCNYLCGRGWKTT